MPTDTITAWIEHDENGKPYVVTDEIDPPSSGTDWAYVEALTDEENLANALSDPDAVILTPERRARLRPAVETRRVRQDLQLTQDAFATRFGIPLGTLRDWEQGRWQPDATARTLLQVISREPDLVAEVVAEDRARRATRRQATAAD